MAFFDLLADIRCLGDKEEGFDAGDRLGLLADRFDGTRLVRVLSCVTRDFACCVLVFGDATFTFEVGCGDFRSTLEGLSSNMASGSWGYV